MIIYTVKSGDSLYSIANRYGTGVDTLVRDNQLTDRRALTVGQTLVILQPRTVYTVQEGENLYSISERFGVPIGELWRNNPFLGGKTQLSVGEVLTIVPEPPISSDPLSVNVYVYPTVDRDILRQTLPYLTYLTLFAYGLEEDGELMEMGETEELVELARQYGVAPIMLVSSVGEDGNFSTELSAKVLTDENIRNMLIEEIAEELSEKRYSGVDIDFEYVAPENADDYEAFIRDLRTRVEPNGFSVFVSLAPKTSANQEGLLYEGHDYRGLGEAADVAFVMTYEWGYTYGPPQAVSPVNKVAEVLDYAVTEIPPEKLIMGMPNYGYDWRLPYVRGESRARSLGNVEAVELARQKRASIEYDELAASPFFRYFDRVNGRPVEHVVWFEDAKSVEAMLALARTYGLRGVGIWNGMRYFPQLWQVLNHTNPIRKILG